jgi:hypothetical protein
MEVDIVEFRVYVGCIQCHHGSLWSLCIQGDFLVHNITQLMSYVHGPCNRFENKLPNVEISMLQIDFEVRANEHNSLAE